jgi:hypothetical protein
MPKYQLTLPDDFKAAVAAGTGGPLTEAFGAQFVALVDEANGIYDQFETIRELSQGADKRLATGNTIEAQNYRSLQTQATEKLAGIKKDPAYDEKRQQIAALQAAIDDDIKARSAHINSVVASARERAIEAEIGSVAAQTDPEALGAHLTRVNTKVKGAHAVLQGEWASLKGFKTLTEAQVKGTRPPQGQKTGERGWRPWVGIAEVDGTPVPYTGKHVTIEDILAHAGIADRDHFLDGMRDKALGGVQVLPPYDQPVTFELDGRTFRISGRSGVQTAA